MLGYINVKKWPFQFLNGYLKRPMSRSSATRSQCDVERVGVQRLSPLSLSNFVDFRFYFFTQYLISSEGFELQFNSILIIIKIFISGQNRELYFPANYFFAERRLMNHRIKKLFVNNLDDCEYLCYLDDNCVSLNIKDKDPKSGTHACELNNSTHRDMTQTSLITLFSTIAVHR